MASTIYKYALEAGRTKFPISFEYLARRFVRVTLIGSQRLELKLNVDYRFTSKMEIETTVAWLPSENYTSLEVRRVTSATDRLVNFTDGSILRSQDLNISQIQAIHIAEEGRDVAENSLQANGLQWDALGFPIKNVGYPVIATDAPNVQYVLDKLSTTLRGDQSERINEIPSDRANKLLAFDANRQPIAIIPSTGSSTELEMELLDATKGASKIGFKYPAVGAASTTVAKRLGILYVTPQDFDPSAGDGTTDAGSAVQKALDYLATKGGGELVYPPGVYRHTTVPKVPVNLPATLRIAAYGARIIVVRGGRMFDIDKKADHDTLQNIIIEGMYVDFSAMDGRNHVLIGTYVNGLQTLYVNFNNIILRNIRGHGPEPDFSKTNHVICLYLQCAHRTNMEPVEGFLDSIVMDNVKMTGGNAGYLILGNSLAPQTTAANINIGTVVVRDSEHKCSKVPSVFYSSSSLHIGLDAIVKSVYIENFYGENPGDNGIELNNVRTGIMVNSRIKNFQNCGYYIDNKHPLFDSDSQTIIHEGCSGDIDGYGVRAFQLGPWRDGTNAPEFGRMGKLGKIAYRDCGVRVRGVPTTASGIGINAGINDEYLYDALEISNFTADLDYDHIAVGAHYPAIFSFRSSKRTRIDIDGLSVNWRGKIVPDGIYRPRVANLFCPDAMLVLRGLRGSFDMTGVTEFVRMISVEAGKASIFVHDSKVDGANSLNLLHVNPADGLDNTHRATFRDIDWTGVTGSIVSGNTTQPQRKYIRMSNVQLATPPGTTPLNVFSSPTTYTNLVGYTQQVYVSGGVGVTIDVDGGTGTYVSTGQVAGAFVLPGGHSIRISYTTTRPTALLVHLEI